MTPGPLVQYLKNNFLGATITVTLVYGGTITGELVDGFDDFIGLKAENTINFVNAAYIVAFV